MPFTSPAESAAAAALSDSGVTYAPQIPCSRVRAASTVCLGIYAAPFLSQDAPHGIRAKGAVFFEARMEVRASLMFIGVS